MLPLLMGVVVPLPVLPESAGWMIVIVFSVAFGVFTILTIKIEELIAGAPLTFDEFNTGGRSTGIGLTASVVVSKWTWAATLLQSSTMAWKLGVSGPYWYAAGASIQIMLFAIVAVKIKERAPMAHSMLEIVRARWGKSAHIVFLVFALMTNLIVTGMLLLGGSAVVHSLTGMPVEAAAFLIPIGVTSYTFIGGLRATFIASYIQTGLIFIIMTIFLFVVYAGSAIGGASGMYDKLVSSLPTEFLATNTGNSYLTMSSSDGLQFGIINIVGNFGAVFVDQSYWQSVFAADCEPRTGSRAFLLGGLVWFSIPMMMATSLGLASRALDIDVALTDANAGLVAALAATGLMGKIGALLILIIVFVAVASTGAAELMAVVSLISYDVYKTYIHPEADADQLLRFSRVLVAVFGVLMGAFGVALKISGLSLNFVYLGMGVCIGSAVVPMLCAILWKKCTGTAAIAGAIVGFVLAIASWLGYAQYTTGSITFASTEAQRAMLIGNVVALTTSALITFIVTLIDPEPDDGDWSATLAITDCAAMERRLPRKETADNVTKDDEKMAADGKDEEKVAADAKEEEDFKTVTKDLGVPPPRAASTPAKADMEMTEIEPIAEIVTDEIIDAEALRVMYAKEWRIALIAGLSLTFVLIFLIPLPLYFADWVFSKAFFTLWVTFMFAWAMIAGMIIIGLPLWDAHTWIFVLVNNAA